MEIDPLGCPIIITCFLSMQIMFVEKAKLRSTLLDEIDESQLPQIYGGKLPLIPIHDES